MKLSLKKIGLELDICDPLPVGLIKLTVGRATGHGVESRSSLIFSGLICTTAYCITSTIDHIFFADVVA